MLRAVGVVSIVSGSLFTFLSRPPFLLPPSCRPNEETVPLYVISHQHICAFSRSHIVLFRCRFGFGHLHRTSVLASSGSCCGIFEVTILRRPSLELQGRVFGSLDFVDTEFGGSTSRIRSGGSVKAAKLQRLLTAMMGDGCAARR